MRTQMHLINLTNQLGNRYILVPEIRQVILENLINVCYPLYHFIIEKEGRILKFRNADAKTNTYSNDNQENDLAQIAVSMNEDSYYTDLIL